MQCLVTGHRGFIGEHLYTHLKSQGYDVVGLDPIEKANETLLSPEAIEKKAKDCDVIFHMGAASGSLWFDKPVHSCEINNTGTLNILEAARKFGCKVIFSSTSSSYASAPLPHKEDHPLDPVNMYTATKMFNENCIKLYVEQYGIEAVILRYMSVYGPNERKKGPLANVLSQFIFKMMGNERPILFGDGQQTRDFVNVEDIVSANIHAFRKLKSGEIYNVGTGIETSFVEAIDMINNILGAHIVPKFVPIKDTSNYKIQKRYVARQKGDINKIIGTGWRPKVDVYDGINRIVAFEQEHNMKYYFNVNRTKV